MDHHITVNSWKRRPSTFQATCSCGVELLISRRFSISLDELSALADEHIADAERAERKRT